MVGKEIAVKKYVVRLSADERGQLETLIRAGERPAQLLTKARILLKADVSAAGDGWSDSRIASDKQTLINEIAAWEKNRNRHHAKADWQFTTADARVKLKRLYPRFD